jgi:hypothetical protein
MKSVPQTRCPQYAYVTLFCLPYDLMHKFKKSLRHSGYLDLILTEKCCERDITFLENRHV